jgi:hypothetical protein
MNSIDPIILFFVFGVLAGVVRAELRLPSQIYDFVSMLLLITIGLKGGIELAKQPAASLLPQVLSVVAMGLLLPILAFPVLHWLLSFSRVDSASIAAHYGSVSVGTFAVVVAYMDSHAIAYEHHMALFVVLLEIPAILVGVLLARGLSQKMHWAELGREILLGKGVVLLVGGLLIGWIAGPQGLVSIKPLFFDLFKGVLALFLLEMGLIAASQLSSLKQFGLKLVVFGIAMPLVSSLVGALLGCLLGLSTGGTAILATLAASASYIAVPAAMRISLPEANPTLSLTASLGITFPFNILIGIPCYYQLAVFMQTYFKG